MASTIALVGLIGLVLSIIIYASNKDPYGTVYFDQPDDNFEQALEESAATEEDDDEINWLD